MKENVHRIMGLMDKTFVMAVILGLAKTYHSGISLTAIAPSTTHPRRKIIEDMTEQGMLTKTVVGKDKEKKVMYLITTKGRNEYNRALKIYNKEMLFNEINVLNTVYKNVILSIEKSSNKKMSKKKKIAIAKDIAEKLQDDEIREYLMKELGV